VEWSGEGLIIGVRKHGESGVIVELMTPDRGRHLGLVRGGRSRKQAATLQPGNTVEVTWRARLEDHLGNFTIELVKGRAADLIGDRLRLYGVQLLCDHLRLLPERDPHQLLLFQAMVVVEGDMEAIEMGEALARFELALLEELGFGLDIYACAVTGAITGLTHISPKSGRAVTAEIAAPYLEKLLPLPAFLLNDSRPDPHDLAAAFRLTGYFLDAHIWSARNISVPAMRERLIEALVSL